MYYALFRPENIVGTDSDSISFGGYWFSIDIVRGKEERMNFLRNFITLWDINKYQDIIDDFGISKQICINDPDL